VQRAVLAAVKHGLTVKAVGAGHSFTGIAVAPGVLLELDDMQGLVSADAAT
jgi:FAD/FMN-containing dehydrogenase